MNYRPLSYAGTIDNINLENLAEGSIVFCKEDNMMYLKSMNGEIIPLSSIIAEPPFVKEITPELIRKIFSLVHLIVEDKEVEYIIENLKKEG